MTRKQFTFYESFFSAISRIKTKAIRCDIYDAVCNFALYGTEPNLEEMPESAAIAFELIRPTLEASKRKAENGRRGGSAKAKDKQTESKTKQTASEKEGENEKEKENENENENEVEKEVEKENECSPSITPPSKEKISASRFAPPSFDEVCAYCRERGNGIDPAQFCDFYASKGWRIGKEPMKDWRAAVRTWERRQDQRQGGQEKSGNVFVELMREAAETAGDCGL